MAPTGNGHSVVKKMTNKKLTIYLVLALFTVTIAAGAYQVLTHVVLDDDYVTLCRTSLYSSGKLQSAFGEILKVDITRNGPHRLKREGSLISGYYTFDVTGERKAGVVQVFWEDGQKGFQVVEMDIRR